MLPVTSVQEQEIDFVAPPTRVFDFHAQATPNYYEALQISPRADHETIHRIYRIMAARFHPDNPVSGDRRRFLQLNEAYGVLSDAGRRAEYDAALQAYEAQPLPIFGDTMFVAGLQGETNRCLGVLSLLYQRRRMNQTHPGLSVLELENRMALPREHLEFTLWYLRSKGLAQMTEERSDYALTVAGIDHIESRSSRNQIVRRLVTTSGEAELTERSERKRVLPPRPGTLQGSRKRLPQRRRPSTAVSASRLT